MSEMIEYIERARAKGGRCGMANGKSQMAKRYRPTPAEVERIKAVCAWLVGKSRSTKAAAVAAGKETR